MEFVCWILYCFAWLIFWGTGEAIVWLVTLGRGRSDRSLRERSQDEATVREYFVAGVGAVFWVVVFCVVYWLVQSLP